MKEGPSPSRPMDVNQTQAPRRFVRARRAGEGVRNTVRIGRPSTSTVVAALGTVALTAITIATLDPSIAPTALDIAGTTLFAGAEVGLATFAVRKAVNFLSRNVKRKRNEETLKDNRASKRSRVEVDPSEEKATGKTPAQQQFEEIAQELTELQSKRAKIASEPKKKRKQIAQTQTEVKTLLNQYTTMPTTSSEVVMGETEEAEEATSTRGAGVFPTEGEKMEEDGERKERPTT